MNRNFICFAFVLLAACVTPVWEPGDGPLTFDADSDETAMLVGMGCALWSDAGVPIVCQIVDSGATVKVWQEDIDGHAAYSKTRPFGFLWTDRYYHVRLDPQVYEMLAVDDPDPEFAEAQLDRAAAIAAHEIGHLMGIWDHLPNGHLMDTVGSTNVVTEGDLAALPWAP